MRQRLFFRLKRAQNLIQRGLRSLRVRGVRGSLAMVSPKLKQQGQDSAMAQLSPEDMAAVFEHDFSCAQPHISLIIPVHNQLALTQQCLAAIMKHSSQSQYELIVVDDHSDDGTSSYLSKLKGIHHIQHSQQQGFVDSCNDGAKNARGEFLCFLNNDTQVQAGFIEQLLSTFATFPDTGIAGAKLLYPNGKLQEAGSAIFNDGSAWNVGRFENTNDSRFDYVRECDYVSGAALAIRRSVFKTLNGFDSLFSPGYYEDADLCFRVRATGLKVRYQPLARVMHHEGASAGTSIEHGGMKAYQRPNQAKFLSRWQSQLSKHPKRPDNAVDLDLLLSRYHQKSILFIDEKTPTPQHDSGSLRLSSLMKITQQQGHHVCFLPLKLEPSESKHLQAAGIQMIQSQSIRERTAFAWLEKNANQFDIIVVSRLATMDALYASIRKFAPKARLIFDTVDLHFMREQQEANIKKSAALQKQAEHSRKKELSFVMQCDETWVVSKTELDFLSSIAPEKTIRLVSNIHAIRPNTPNFSTRQDIVFVGSFGHPPNYDGLQWFVEQCWSSPTLQTLSIRLHVIGSGLTEAQKKMLASHNLIFHGHVDDIQAHLDKARINIAPLRYGAGAKGKISQALACRLPSVITSVAADGMFLQNHVSALIADSPQDFITAIEKLYTDEMLWDTVSQQGSAIAQHYYSEQAALDVLNAAFVRATP